MCDEDGMMHFAIVDCFRTCRNAEKLPGQCCPYCPDGYVSIHYRCLCSWHLHLILVVLPVYVFVSESIFWTFLFSESFFFFYFSFLWVYFLKLFCSLSCSCCVCHGVEAVSLDFSSLVLWVYGYLLLHSIHFFITVTTWKTKTQHHHSAHRFAKLRVQINCLNR